MNQDKSARYHALKRRASILAVAWSAAFLAALAFSPASRWLADLATSAASRVSTSQALLPTVTVIAYVALVGVLHEVVGLPLSFYRGFLLEHRYGLSNETVRHWVLDELKSGALGALLSFGGFALLYLAMRRWPSGWWLPAGAGFALFVVLAARLAPVLLLPIFFQFEPLARDDLERRLLELSCRAGVPVTDVRRWRLSDRTKKANAALTGLGRTRRILLSDTLLAAYDDDEIEAVLAHELAHHAHHDIWKGLTLEIVAAFLGFFVASRVMLALVSRLRWSGVADVAGLPVLLLVATALSLALLPVVNGLSRAMERAADRFSLEITGNPGAFASAMQRLGVQNMAEERPSRIVRWLFYSHPPFEERIAAAREWESRRGRS